MEIRRKDGIVYNRKEKNKNYDMNVHLRLKESTLDYLKKEANKSNKKISTYIRNILEDLESK